MYMVNGAWDIVTFILIVSLSKISKHAANQIGRLLGGNKG